MAENTDETKPYQFFCAEENIVFNVLKLNNWTKDERIPFELVSFLGNQTKFLAMCRECDIELMKKNFDWIKEVKIFIDIYLTPVVEF